MSTPLVQAWARTPRLARGRWAVLTASVVISCCAALSAAGPAAAAAWRSTHVPLPAGSVRASLNGVSCARVNLCWGVGMASSRDHERRAFVERWNGRAWSPAPLSLPARLGETGLFGVSCSGPSACMAVGSTSVDDGGTFSEQWRGGAWRYVATPSPSDTALGAVSCAGPSFCLAVGSTDIFKDGIFNYSLNLVWNGTSWTRQPYGETGSLNAVSCPSATFCAGVGLISDSAGNNSVAERWNGTAIADAPSGDGRAGSLQGVSCPSATFCLAVGSAFGRIATVWNGSRWRSTPSPGALHAVSCQGPRSCVAVGGRIARWNGTSWTRAPKAVSAGASLVGVTCRGGAMCLAVGAAGSKPVAVRYG